MPVYTYHCEQCHEDFDDSAPLAEYKDPRPCPACTLMSPRTLGDFPGFVLRGDDFPGKNNRIRGQKARRNQHLASKEREMKGDGMVPSLVPNVGGERTDSWAEASRLAASRGKDTSGYDTYARKEKTGGT